MLKKLPWLVVLVSATALLWAQDAAESPLAKARRLAFSGREHRAEALAVLQAYLKEDPTDSDARTFYGIVLSWEGRYDEARQQLEEVLATHPNHGDAAPALVRVELWSDHPARAEELAAAYLQQKKKDTDMMLLLARSQRNQNRYKDALHTIDELLLIDPSNQDARHMRRTLTVDSWHWEASATHTTDFLGQGRSPQNEDSWQARGPTRFGSLIGRVSRSDSFGLTSYQISIRASGPEPTPTSTWARPRTRLFIPSTASAPTFTRVWGTASRSAVAIVACSSATTPTSSPGRSTSTAATGSSWAACT
jgi:tetratricopeptide (TPR) repeat protein